MLIGTFFFRNNFQALAIAADEEWAKQICHLWPDHQRRLNTANNWPPLEMIIREMRTIVEDSVERLFSRTSNSQFNPGRDWSYRVGSIQCHEQC